MSRHDWYQTNTHVVLSVLMKNANKDDVTVEFQEAEMEVNISLPEKRTYQLNLFVLQDQHIKLTSLGGK